MTEMKPSSEEDASGWAEAFVGQMAIILNMIGVGGSCREVEFAQGCRA